MKDMDKAVEILRMKIAENKKIRIIGDYDIDGVTATCILLKGLKRLGAQADTCIPDRIKDGYGLHEQLIDQAVSFAEKIVGKKIDYENLIFDYANDYAHKMMDESDEERNAITDSLS